MNRRPNAFQKLVHRFLMLKPVSLALSKILHRADLFLLRLTANRFTFAELVGLPVAQVTMEGAKTGKIRTLPLVSIPDGDKFVLIATNFGQKNNPAWYYNLIAHPHCIVTYDVFTGDYVARQTAGADYTKYWQLALTYYAGYQVYKKWAVPRIIPILVLEPKK